MRIKQTKLAVLVLAVILAAAFGGACSLIGDTGTIADALNNTGRVKIMDATVNFSLTSEDLSVTLAARTASTDDRTNPRSFLSLSDGHSTIIAYTVDEYQYVSVDGESSVIKTADEDWYDYTAEIPKFEFSGIDLSKTENQIHTQMLLGQKVLYTVNADGFVLNDLLNGYLGELPPVKAPVTMEIKIDTVKMLVDQLKITSEFSAGEKAFSFGLTVTVNAVGSAVKIELPETVTEEIEKAKSSSIPGPSGPNGPLIPEEPDPADPSFPGEPDPVTPIIPNENTGPADPLTYTGTSDGAVKFYDLGTFKKVVYDKKTDTLVVLRTNAIEFYDAATMTRERTLSYLITPACLDADNGKLVIGFGVAAQFQLYDLADYTVVKTVQTNISVTEIVIDGETVIYADDDQWCDIVFYNTGTGNQKLISWGAYQPRLSINRADHILYLAETGLSSCALMYFNSQTGDQLYESDFSQFMYLSERPYYNGKYVLYANGAYNRFSGLLTSSTSLTAQYNALSGFTPKKTVLDSERLAFVSGVGATYETAIYDYQEGRYIYRFGMQPTEVSFVGDGNYFAVDADKRHVAFVDMSKIPDGFTGNIYEENSAGTVTVSADGKTKTLRQSAVYSQSVADEKYIYLLGQFNYSLEVYDAASLEKVYSEKFAIKPECLDAAGGVLVVGFGEGRQFRIYDTEAWTNRTVAANDCVYSIIVHNGKIAYTPIDQHCQLFIYNMNTDAHESFGYYSYYYPRLAIDRTTDILYIGEHGSSSCDLVYFNLNTKKEVYCSPFSTFSYNNIRIYFDGEYVHYYGRSFDKTTGLMISQTNQALVYNGATGYSAIKTVYNDADYSVFTAAKNGNIYTVVYDRKTGSVHTEFAFDTDRVAKVDGTLVFLDDATDIFRTYKR